MTRLSAFILALAVTVPAAAQVVIEPQTQNGSPIEFAQLQHTNLPRGEGKLFTCWYGADGKLTGALPTEGNLPPYLVLANRGDHQTWAYTYRSRDGHECPAQLPPL